MIIGQILSDIAALEWSTTGKIYHIINIHPDMNQKRLRTTGIDDL